MRGSMQINASPNSPARIIVLGAERSGTSVVTDMVHRWGAYAGEPEQLTAANEHNPQGQWEYKPLWDFLVEVGDFAQGVTWWDAAFEAHITAKLQLPALRDKALALIAEMEREGRPWVWKDPALCHFLPFWKPIWEDVAYVITVRHPYDVAISWQRYAVPAYLQGSVNLVACNLLRWQHMMLMVLRATDDVDRKLFVEYEALVREPLAQAHRLAAFLDEHCGGAPSTAQSVRAMAERVNPALWRNHSDRPLSEIAEATPAQRRLYEFVRSKVKDPGKAFVDEYPMPPGWWEFVHNEEAAIRAHSQ
jgi:O-antigen biosynthesis protein